MEKQREWKVQALRKEARGPTWAPMRSWSSRAAFLVKVVTVMNLGSTWHRSAQSGCTHINALCLRSSMAAFLVKVVTVVKLGSTWHPIWGSGTAQGRGPKTGRQPMVCWQA